MTHYDNFHNTSQDLQFKSQIRYFLLYEMFAYVSVNLPNFLENNLIFPDIIPTS